MTMDNGANRTTLDYLEAPPMKQATPDDTRWALQQSLTEGFRRLRYEALKLNPDVLCETKVYGGNTISDVIPKRVWFEIGGKPVTVYKIMLWNGTDAVVTCSVAGMSESDDGFAIPAGGASINVPLKELSIAIPTGTTIGVNLASSVPTDGSVFIYGFTIPDYEEMDWR